MTPAATAAFGLVEAAARKRWGRAERVIATAADVAGVAVDELETRIAESDERLELAAQVLTTAAQTTIQAKSDALAQAMAAISTAGAEQLQQVSLVVRALAVLDGLDLLVLDLVGGLGTEGATPAQLESGTGLPAEVLRSSVRLLELHGLTTDRNRLNSDAAVLWQLTELGRMMLGLLHAEGNRTDAAD
jgi:hypothetical protein